MIPMANITAAMVKDLREKTGAGMMDCKTALNETGGDMEAAVDWLRTKGLSKAAKKADRVAADGLVGVVVRDTHGVVVEVNAETDFVARNEEFQSLVRTIAEVASEKGAASVETLKAQHYPGAAGSVADAIANAIATIGENMNLRRAAEVKVEQGVIGHYVHGAIADGLGKIGVIVGLESKGDPAVLAPLAKQIAMHVAAASPFGLDQASIDPSVIEREKNVLREKNAGKPANVLEKIVESGIKSYLKEVSLIDQPSIHADHAGKSIGQVVKEIEGKAGAPVALKGFVRYALGEGVEKQEAADFASEVASMAKG
jgi:elongation factor Ts